MKTVEIFTQPGCPYCVRALQILRSKDIPFREIDAPHGTAERDEAMRRSGSRTVPQIFLGETNLGGCTDLMQLDATGALDQLLASA